MCKSHMKKSEKSPGDLCEIGPAALSSSDGHSLGNDGGQFDDGRAGGNPQQQLWSDPLCLSTRGCLGDEGIKIHSFSLPVDIYM